MSTLRRRRRAMSARVNLRTIIRMVMVVVMVATTRQHQQQRNADNGNNQLSHVSLVLSCPHIIAHFHAAGELVSSKGKNTKTPDFRGFAGF